jgi:hypothetical protein
MTLAGVIVYGMKTTTNTGAATTASSYYDSAEDTEISFERAAAECRKHFTSVVEMIDALGNSATYDAQAVLGWLGY